MFKWEYFVTQKWQICYISQFKCSKISPPTSMHSATRVRRSRIVRLSGSSRFFMQATASKMRYSEQIVWCIPRKALTLPPTLHVWGYEAVMLRLWGCEAMKVWGCEAWAVRVWGCEAMKLWGCDSMRLWGLGYEAVRLWRYEAVRLWRCEFMRLWGLGYEAVSLWFYEAVKKMAVWRRTNPALLLTSLCI